MTSKQSDEPSTEETPSEEAPEKVPPKAWVTLTIFAGFVILFFTCATTFMFN